MRTTVTLDPDVAERLKELAHQRRASFKETINDVIRRGLGAQAVDDDLPPFVVEPHQAAFRPGIDVGKLNQLADEVDVQDFAREAAETR